jgi:hypothetical protein
VTIREYKMTLLEGCALYARIEDKGNWSCEVKGGKWYPIQQSKEPIWVACRKWDGVPKFFGIEESEWNTFRQGVQVQENDSDRESAKVEETDEGITPEIITKAVEILKNGDPVTYFLDAFNRIHVGDRDLGQILLYCVGAQHDTTSDGLHPKLSGESGMGKSDAVETFLHLLPKCAYIRTSLSSKAIFYHPIAPGTVIFQDDYKQNDDLDTIIKQTSSRFHEPYEHRTITKDREAQVLQAPPEIVWAITSVDSSQDIQVLNRVVGMDVDGSELQTRAVFKHFLNRASKGEVKFPLTEEILICRAMILEIRKHQFKVIIPYAERIKWNDISSRRNLSIFLDIIKANAVWWFMQRRVADEVVEATESDFNAAKTLYIGRADTLIDKLTKKERELAETINRNGGEMYREDAAKSMNVSVARISQLVHGEKGKTGLLQKLPAFNVNKVTEKDDPSRNVTRTLLTLSYYSPFDKHAVVVSLEPTSADAIVE